MKTVLFSPHFKHVKTETQEFHVSLCHTGKKKCAKAGLKPMEYGYRIQEHSLQPILLCLSFGLLL